MTARYDVVIVGAGHGGAQVAVALRQGGFVGSIAMIGDEPDLPYERPPLSKDYLSGLKSFERLLIKPAAFWESRDIAVLLGKRVVEVRAAAHSVVIDDGEIIDYGALVWATGGRPRRLSCAGHHLSGIHTVRNRADVDRMILEMDAVQSAVIVGGGYIGLEAAAVMTKLGKHVTVLEAQDRLLARVAGAPLSRFLEQEHRAHGVDVRLGVTVESTVGRDGAACAVRLADGHELRCDMVIVGIGIVPAVEPLLNAGAVGGNGVFVDAQCRTSLEDVFAIGDCALHRNAFADGAEIRLESVQNANDQAATVAKVLLGTPQEYHALPWFWSQQYDLKLQTVGLSIGHDDTVVRGDPATRAFSVVYLKNGRVIAIDCINAVKDYVQGRALILVRASVPADRLADTSIALKSML